MNGQAEDDALISALRSSYENVSDQAPEAGTVIGAVRRRRRHRTLAGAGALGALTVAGIAGLVFTPGGDDDGASTVSVADGPVKVLGDPMGIEKYPSHTVKHWLTFADAVVVVTAGEEFEGRTVGLGDGSGNTVTGRDVSVQVERVVWKVADEVRFPDQLRVSTAGWFDDGSGRVPASYGNTPRIEDGNTYLLAIRSDQPCSADSQWTVLGSDAAWAVSDGIVGVGESSGRAVSGEKAQANPLTFEARMLNKPVDRVAQVLSAAAAKTEPRPPTC